METSVRAVVPGMPADRGWLNLAWKSTTWAVLLGLMVHYFRRDALHYLLQYTPESFKTFWPRRILIRAHIAAATIMIVTGTLQLWTGFRMRYRTLHVWCGRTFLAAGTFAAGCALYMGLHPLLGSIVYGLGLFFNGLFWLAAAGMAFYAIRIGNIQVHKEWMIRTYVLTYAGLVGDRLIPDLGFLRRAIGADALNDLSTWLNWTAPLMVTEIVLQLRRLRKPARHMPGRSNSS